MTQSVVHRVSLGSLHPGLQNVLVVGIIIAKHESRRIVTRAEGTEKTVAQMTIRDSPDDFINLTLWLSPDLAKEVDSQYHIGDVVEISNPRIQSKDTAGANERYLPHVSSPFSLVFSEPHSRLSKLSLGSPDFSSLMSLPTKASVNFFTLTDVQNNPRLSPGDHVDILAAVQAVGPIRRFKGRDEEEREMREIRLFDQTGSGLVMKLWNFDWVRLAENWMPGIEILFLADVRVNKDGYRNCNVISATSKTIITVNPSTEESRLLAEYAEIAKSSILGFQSDQSGFSVDFQSITRISNIVSIQDLFEPACNSNDDVSQYTTIVYGYFTKFDIDADISSVVLRRCSRCRALLSKGASACLNCEFDFEGNSDVVDQMNVYVDITDFTGTLIKCKINADVLERLICPLDQFLTLSIDERTKLKWDHVLEPVKIWLLVLLPSTTKKASTVNVLNWSRISLEELATNSPMPPVQ